MGTAIFVNILSILSALTVNKKIGWKHGLFMSFVILFIYMAIRYDYCNDYMAYLHMFQESAEYKDPEIDVEKSWILICQFFKPIGFFGFVIVLSFLNCVTLYHFIKKNVSEEYYWFAIFLYTFVANHMVMGLSMMRQFMVMMLFIISTVFIIKKKKLLYIISILILSTIHNSAIILLPLVFINYTKPILYNRKFFIIVIGAYTLWYLLGAYLIKDVVVALIQILNLARYEEMVQEADSRIAITLPYQLMMLYFTLKSYNKFDPYIRLLAKFTIIGLCLEPIVGVAPLASRLFFYFSILSIVVYPKIIETIKSNSQKYIIILSTIIINVYRFNLFFASEVWYEKLKEYKTIFEINQWL